MIKPKHYTTNDIKEKNWDWFTERVKDQWQYGGAKYANSDQRESTDIITEACGVEWVIGTCIKYLLRFKNLQRPRDVYKIACYMYILALQMGYHIDDGGDTDTWNEEREDGKKER